MRHKPQDNDRFSATTRHPGPGQNTGHQDYSRKVLMLKILVGEIKFSKVYFKKTNLKFILLYNKKKVYKNDSIFLYSATIIVRLLLSRTIISIHKHTIRLKLFYVFDVIIRTTNWQRWLLSPREPLTSLHLEIPSYPPYGNLTINNCINYNLINNDVSGKLRSWFFTCMIIHIIM